MNLQIKKSISKTIVRYFIQVSSYLLSICVAKFVQKNNLRSHKDRLVYLSPMIDSRSKLPETFGLMMLPIAVGLSKQKYNVRYLCKSKMLQGLSICDDAPLVYSGKFGDIRFDSGSHSDIDKLLSMGCEDLKNKDFEYDGVDYYEVCLAEVRNYCKKYTASEDNDNEKRLFDKFFIDCVNVHKAIASLVNENKDNKITIIGNESNDIPNSAIWWSLKNGRWSNVEYVECTRGYQQYWGGHFRDLEMTSRNVTKYGELLLYVTPQELHQRMTHLDKNNLEKSLPSRQNDRKIDEFVYNISEWKEVFCLYSHVLRDVRIPDSSGEFTGLVEWVNSVCGYFASNKEKLLIIKPHPDEKPEIKKKEPKEKTKDVIYDIYKSSPNIKILPAERIGGVEEVIDCGLVWRSSVGLELGARRVPLILFGYPDYQYLPFVKCRSKAQLKHILDERMYLKQDEHLASLCAAYLMERQNRIVKLDMLKYSKKYNKIHPFSLKTLNFLVGIREKEISPLTKQLINEIEDVGTSSGNVKAHANQEVDALNQQATLH